MGLASTILDVLAAFDGTMSTRQVFYQCVSRGAVPNSVREYDRVQRLLVEMRRTGEVPFERIVDRTRQKHQRSSWEGVSDMLEAVAMQYRRDVWAEQPTVVMVACEKQALEGIFAEEVDRYGAALWVCRGYPSEAYLFEWSTEIRRIAASGRMVDIPYFGDHDPSGLDIERAITKGLERFKAPCTFYRASLHFRDIELFEIPPLEVKQRDARAAGYLKIYGNVGAELDALPPNVLRSRIRECIARHINVERWARVEAAEQAERESLQMIAGNWAASAANDGGAA